LLLRGRGQKNQTRFLGNAPIAGDKKVIDMPRSAWEHNAA